MSPVAVMSLLLEESIMKEHHRSRFSLPTLRGCVLAVAGLAVSVSTGCVFTSPHWDYVPESTTTAIPFQMWTPVTTSPVVVECAVETSAHGWPVDGDDSYIVVDTIPVSTGPLLDSDGMEMFTASAMLTLPSDCWDYFGSYDFWQANVRVSQEVPNIFGSGTSTQYFSSFDLAGLACLGQNAGANASWLGHLDEGCEKTYLGTDDVIPYLVMRIDGYANGLQSTAKSLTAPERAAKSERVPSPLEKPSKDIKLSPIKPIDEEVLKAIKSGELEPPKL